MTVAATSSPRKRAAALPFPQAADLLVWYDRHRRQLPWRAAPGATPDSYQVWLSEIMLQQTTVKAVAPYFARFLARWPDVATLAAAPLEDVLKLWAGLGYYARARNLHACAQAVARHHHGRFPATEPELAALPGIGSYTAAAIAAIAFGARTVAVDGNVERVISRLYAVDQALPAAKPEIRRLAGRLVPEHRTGDFAQALMDLGATICTPRRPTCGLCPWMEACTARRRGEPEGFPIKLPKREGRLRGGAAFVVLRSDGYLLVRSRPPRGLLGGMTEVPTTAWEQNFDPATALADAPRLSGARPTWRRLPGVVRHVFTHFPLELVVYAAEVRANVAAPNTARWVALADLPGEALPNVMRKVVAHALRSMPSGRSTRSDER